MNEIWIAPLAGGDGVQLLTAGRLIGQVDDGILIVDQTDSPFGPWSLKRFVADSGSDVSGAPQEFIGASAEDPAWAPFYTYTGAVSFGSTAILTAQAREYGAGLPTYGIILRSTDTGASFTEVMRWELASTTGKFGQMEIGYAGGKAGVWWVSGAVAPDWSALGLWRSEDDGLTWSFVPVPTDNFIVGMDNTPAIRSAKRPEGASR